MGKFILWCHERSVTQAAEVTREMVQRYQRHLYYYRKRNGQPLALSSQTHWLVGLRGWFRWLARERYLEVDPAAHLELPRDEQRLPRHALSPSEAEAILAQPDIATPLGLRDRAILETLYSTGLRRRKCCGWTSRTWTASGARSWSAAARGTKTASCQSARAVA